MFAVVSSLPLIGAWQSTSDDPSATSKKETLLAPAGFGTKAVTTPKHQQRASALTPGEVSTVTYGGKLYYVYPTATKDRVLVGNQTYYNIHKQSVVAYGLTTSPFFVDVTHGPDRVLIQEFDGFGPLGE